MMGWAEGTSSTMTIVVEGGTAAYVIYGGEYIERAPSIWGPPLPVSPPPEPCDGIESKGARNRRLTREAIVLASKVERRQRPEAAPPPPPPRPVRRTCGISGRYRTMWA